MTPHQQYKPTWAGAISLLIAALIVMAVLARLVW